MKKAKDFNFSGIWKVTVTKGPLWFKSLNLLNDHKVISCDNGVNIIRTVEWGSFKIKYYDHSIQFIYLDSPIIDEVTPISPNYLKGTFYLKDKLIGHFDLHRVTLIP